MNLLSKIIQHKVLNESANKTIEILVVVMLLNVFTSGVTCYICPEDCSSYFLN